MKKMLICLFVGALSLPSVACETQLGQAGATGMMRDRSPSFSLKILNEGLGGRATGTILPPFYLEKGYYFTPGIDYGVISNGAINGRSERIFNRSAFPYTQYYNNYRAGNRPKWYKNALGQAFDCIEVERDWSGLSETAGQTVSMADEAVNNRTWSGIVVTTMIVPAPGALLLAGIGTLLVGFLRRRNRE